MEKYLQPMNGAVGSTAASGIDTAVSKALDIHERLNVFEERISDYVQSMIGPMPTEARTKVSGNDMDGRMNNLNSILSDIQSQLGSIAAQLTYLEKI